MSVLEFIMLKRGIISIPGIHFDRTDIMLLFVLGLTDSSMSMCF